jgi:hypothetical protein
VRYRKPKVAERGGGAGGKGEEGATYFYRKAKGLNQSLRTKCKYVDPQTGEVCGKNTPQMANVRHLLLEDILGFAPFAPVGEDCKQAIRDILASQDGDARRRERLENVLGLIDLSEYLEEQIKDIIFGKGDGRAQFCRSHILGHHSQTETPKQAAWLPPSLKLKQDFILKVIRERGKPCRIDRIIIERANFDLQKIAAGVIEDPREYQQGYRYGFRNTRAALMQEYGARCCYCGKSVAGQKWHIDHVDPRRTGEINRWDNLAIACEKCNHSKGGKTPKDAGMRFAVVTEKVAGRKIRRSLAPKPVEGTRIHKYMTQTDQGINMLKNALREIFPAAPIEETFGYETAAWRDLWGLEKGKEKGEHHNDAIVIASARVPEGIPKADAQPEAISQTVGGKRLFDLNPVSRSPNGRYYQRTPVLAESGGITPRQLPAVVDQRKRKLLAREFERYGIEGNKKLPDRARERLPFKSVLLLKRDCADGNVRRMRTGHSFKVSNAGGTRVNEAVIVYENLLGKLSCYPLKNPRAFGPTRPPDDFKRELFRFRAGDRIVDLNGRSLGEVVEFGSDGRLTTDKGHNTIAHRCRRGS